MTRGRLAVVVVAYGPAEPLVECLETLGQLPRDHPVVVVDNSSSPATRRAAEDAGARYVDPGGNLGFAAGVNVALRELTGDSAQPAPASWPDVLLLNPDARADPATVDGLWQALREDPVLGAVGPAQAPAAAVPPHDPRWAFHSPAGAWAEALGLARRRRPEVLSGAALMLSGAALGDVGLFDEHFFLYFEDEDWQRRARGRGWGLGYRPELCVLHRPGGTESDPLRFQRRLHAAAERYVRKWFGPWGWASYRLATVTGLALRVSVGGRAHRRRYAALLRLYLAGPDRVARRSGAVPASP